MPKEKAIEEDKTPVVLPNEKKKPGRKKKVKTPIKFHITHEPVVLIFN